MIDWVVEPWQSGLAARAGLALILVGILGGALGVAVTLRGLAFTTEAFAHTAFPGAVLAAAAGGSLLLGGLVATLMAAGALALAARARVDDQTAISVVFTGLFASGAILVATLGPLERDITSFLFGSVLAVDRWDLLAIAIGTAAVILTLVVIHRPLLALGFDPTGAAVAGVRATRIELALYVTLAVAVVLLVQAIGNMLVVAMLVTPAATARLCARRLGPTVVLAVGFGVSAALVGIYLSYYASAATGASVVLVATAQLILAAAWSARGRLRHRSPTVAGAT